MTDEEIRELIGKMTPDDKRSLLRILRELRELLRAQAGGKSIVE